MSRILVASITMLCRADHRDDPAALAAWLANKTPETVARWLREGPSQFLVAMREDVLVGVGAVQPADREILLNYVDPAACHIGVSSALLMAMESTLGTGVARLSSTATAREFYRHRGWADAGEAQTWHGMSSFPMIKTLG